MVSDQVFVCVHRGIYIYKARQHEFYHGYLRSEDGLSRMDPNPPQFATGSVERAKTFAEATVLRIRRKLVMSIAARGAVSG